MWPISIEKAVTQFNKYLPPGSKKRLERAWTVSRSVDKECKP